MNLKKIEKMFVVVMRGSSAAIFKLNEPLIINFETPEYGMLQVTYATRRIKKSNDVTVPGHIWIEIRGYGDELEKVLNVYGNIGIFGLSLISVSANAAIGDVEIEIGYDATPNVKDREYFQRFLPGESHELSSAVAVNHSATVKLFEYVHQSEEQERILRAANQYMLALDWWCLGKESMCVAHLWMAIEALSPAFLRRELIKHNLKSGEELAQKLQVDIRQLDGTIRKILILKGDEECYKKAADASNGFEHGYLDFRDIRNKATDVRHRLASHVRNAILEISGVDKEIFTLLVSEPFDKPYSNQPLVKYIKGRLLGDVNELSQQGSSYPFIKWKTEIKSCKEDELGKINVEVTDNLTPELADGVSFSLRALEVWKPE